MAGQRFAYCWFLRIEVPHLIGMLSENQVGIAERVARTCVTFSQLYNYDFTQT
jgi:hypothetical protein